MPISPEDFFKDHNYDISKMDKKEYLVLYDVIQKGIFTAKQNILEYGEQANAAIFIPIEYKSYLHDYVDFEILNDKTITQIYIPISLNKLIIISNKEFTQTKEIDLSPNKIINIIDDAIKQNIYLLNNNNEKIFHKPDNINAIITANEREKVLSFTYDDISVKLSDQLIKCILNNGYRLISLAGEGVEKAAYSAENLKTGEEVIILINKEPYLSEVTSPYLEYLEFQNEGILDLNLTIRIFPSFICDAKLSDDIDYTYEVNSSRYIDVLEKADSILGEKMYSIFLSKRKRDKINLAIQVFNFILDVWDSFLSNNLEYIDWHTGNIAFVKDKIVLIDLNSISEIKNVKLDRQKLQLIDIETDEVIYSSSLVNSTVMVKKMLEVNSDNIRSHNYYEIKGWSLFNGMATDYKDSETLKSEFRRITGYNLDEI